MQRVNAIATIDEIDALSQPERFRTGSAEGRIIPCRQPDGACYCSSAPIIQVVAHAKYDGTADFTTIDNRIRRQIGSYDSDPSAPSSASSLDETGIGHAEALHIGTSRMGVDPDTADNRAGINHRCCGTGTSRETP